jgi:hypothetical protein
MNSNTKLSPLLVEAKDQYIHQLAEIIAPYVIHSVNGAYQYAKKHAKYGQSTVEFQKKLKEIPQWNSNTIHQQVSAISSKYRFLSDLIAACFVSYVKILSSVKIHAQKPNIRLKLPADDVFVHRVFALSAKEFYIDPALVKADRATRRGIVRRSVETAVRDLLPIQDILRAYLGNTVDDDGVNPEEIDEDEFDLSASSVAESEPAASPVASPIASPVASPVAQPMSGIGQEQALAQLQQILGQQQAASQAVSQAASPQAYPDTTRVIAPSPLMMAPSIAPSPAKSIRVPLGNPGAFVTPLGFDDAGEDRFFK